MRTFGKRFLLVALCILVTQQLNAKQSYREIIDSLKLQLAQTHPSIERVGILNDLSYAYNRVNPDSLYMYAIEAYELAVKIGDKKGQGIALKNKASGHHRLSHPYDSLLKCYRMSIKIAEEIKDYHTIATWDNNVAFSYLEQGNDAKALASFIGALEILDEHVKAPSTLKVLVLGNIGTTFSKLNNHKSAVEYLTRAIEYGKEHDFKKESSMYLDNLGEELYIQGKKTQAFATIKEALTLAKNNKDPKTEAQVLMTYGELLRKEGKISAAKDTTYKAYILAKKFNLNNEIMAMVKLSELELLKENPKQALMYANMVLDDTKYLGKPIFRQYALEAIKNVYIYTENYKQVHIIDSQIDVLKDSIQNKYGSTREMLARYENREQRIEIERLQKEHNEAKVRNRNYLLVGLLILFGLLGALFYRTIKHNTTLQLKNRELKVARQEAIEALSVKQSFLSTMSHEIRTPMNAVIGFTDILIKQNKDERQRTFLNSLKVSSEYLLSLLNNVLDYSKLEAGKMPIEQIPFDLEEHIENVIEVFRISNQNPQLAIKYQANLNLQHHVLGDPTRLRQVLNNLVGNAVKFTPNGYVHLKVTTLEHTTAHIKLKFTIKDTGIGIAEEKLSSVFEGFEQASSATNRRFGGSGLGLSITKQILDLHDSEILLESEEGKGSTFSFNLSFPITSKSLLSQTTQTQNRKLPILRNKRILLAEDNVFNQKVALNILTDCATEVVIAENGKKALKCLQKEEFDIILMDLHMPEMDGFEAIQHLLLAGVNSPIIALTATTIEELANYPYLNGIDVLTKPFRAEELIQILVKNLSPKELAYMNS